jgi:predicted RNA binding protein YcfA (HicA-like mRNA interferase family)
MPYNYKEIEKRLLALGYKIVRQNWSHVIFTNWKVIFPVPKHWWTDISPWVEAKIIKNIWISKDEFRKIK